MAEFNTAARRRLLATSTLSAGVLLALVLFVIVNYLGWKYYQRFDWTRSRLYTLSEKSENVLRELDRDIEIVNFLSPGDSLYVPVRELLARYAAASPSIQVREVDPEKNILEAQSLVDKYELSQLGVVVFDSGEDRRLVETSDLADYDYSGLQFGQGPQMTGFKGEQLFTSTLLELMESRKPRILFTTGHGEIELDDFSPRGFSTARDLLRRDNYDLEEWASLGQAAVPEGTDLLVIAGPTANFIEPEIRMLRGYLEAAGRLLVLLDPTLAPTGGLVETGLEALLAEYGVRVGDDIVVDPANPLPFFSAETIFVSSYGDHSIVRPLRQAQIPAIIALARSVGAGEPVDGLEVSELLQTTEEGWGETDLANLDRVDKQETDLAGPVPLAVAVVASSQESDSSADTDDLEVEDLRDDETSPGAEASEPSEMAGVSDAPVGEASVGAEERGTPAEEGGASDDFRLVVFGDSDFATNGQLQNAANATLLANACNWLAEREALVSIPPKEPEQVQLSLTRSELARVTWLVLVILPGSAIALGVYIHWRRRR